MLSSQLDLWKKRKKELGWTHDDLARESGISRRTIAGIFGGDPRYESPTYNTIQAIEKALGLSPSAWTEEEKAEGVGRHPTYLSEDEVEWLELRSEILEKRGNEFYAGLVTTLKALIKAL